MELYLEGNPQFRQAVKRTLGEIVRQRPELFSRMLAETFQDFVSSQGFRVTDPMHYRAPAEAVRAMARGA